MVFELNEKKWKKKINEISMFSNRFLHYIKFRLFQIEKLGICKFPKQDFTVYLFQKQFAFQMLAKLAPV